ncbi:hypothetical protein IG605_011790 [Pectobacterium quasiaquaticum]|uniref:hypothetical protein n=1 Tax=Pectobacterium quasiaquaticum TaxID=2774015 RepID=UPI001875A7FB|nr:hypothetical protein [Pectobacterium quasiaquaticum]URG51407.1 hypothetical protein IG605_011790 [Pectobacterium quasiaquaticum]
MINEENNFFYSRNEKLFYIGGDPKNYPKDVITVSEKEMLDIVEENKNPNDK